MDELEQLVRQAGAEIDTADSSAALTEIETRFLGGKGSVQAQLRAIGSLPKEERPAFGARVNAAKQALTERLEVRRSVLDGTELNVRLESEKIDVTLPGRPIPAGRRHPLTQTMRRVKEVLIGQGYEIVEGPELEEYRYNFAALNYPEDHPAFDEQMTFYVDDARLMRTQTTALQGRVMEHRKPPFRIATTGRCFRYEAVDATHHHTFHQVDVFMVDEGISMADLKGTLKQFASAIIGGSGGDVQVRFRPDFFPFVEPGVDYSIFWKGRWLELGGAGLIHPNILETFGIDSERWSGFAFGLGIERIHMTQNGVTDLRLYLENDLRFLRQFLIGIGYWVFGVRTQYLIPNTQYPIPNPEYRIPNTEYRIPNMRLPVEWIKEYLPVEAGAEAIADTLTMAGLEVEERAEFARGAVLDIKVTPNRGDCLSLIGVVRELSAAYGVPPRVPETTHAHGAGDAASLTSVTIEAPDLCPRYAARIVRHLKPGTSPPWMQERLEAAGMRPINNIVDVTNYVMLETGQPLHAFDYDTLNERRIVVRRARVGETITTLDGEQRALNPEMLVIADARRPVAVAGVMGGIETEMSHSTRMLLLELAHFHPLSVRRTARALGMRTEASYRFERSVDPAGVAVAADRACQLIGELGMGEVVPGIVDIHPGSLTPRLIEIRPARVGAMLGFDVTAEQVVDTLTRLGFAIDPSSVVRRPSSVAITVPSWRPDVVREIDVVEEVGRVLGYQHIPERLPVGPTLQGADSARSRFAEHLRETLAGCGLQEIVSHSLLAPNPLDEDVAGGRVAIRSALSAELSGLRRSLLPGLIETMDRNARRGLSPLAFFEIGNVFKTDGNACCEVTAVGGAIAGPLTEVYWSREDSEGPADFYAARGIVERLADGMGAVPPAFEPGSDARLHPGRQAAVILNGQAAGVVGELHPRLAAELRIRDRVVVFEVSLEALAKTAETRERFVALSDYPPVTRDLAPRVAAELPFAAVRQAVEAAQVRTLERWRLTDVYTGAPLPEGVKSLTLSFTFRAPDRTLTESEVADALAQIRGSLESDCGATFAA